MSSKKKEYRLRKKKKIQNYEMYDTLYIIYEKRARTSEFLLNIDFILNY